MSSNNYLASQLATSWDNQLLTRPERAQSLMRQVSDSSTALG